MTNTETVLNIAEQKHKTKQEEKKQIESLLKNRGDPNLNKASTFNSPVVSILEKPSKQKN